MPLAFNFCPGDECDDMFDHAEYFGGGIMHVKYLLSLVTD